VTVGDIVTGGDVTGIDDVARESDDIPATVDSSGSGGCPTHTPASAATVHA
jgi:hypothetical protein